MMMLFCVLVPCRPIGRCQCFRETYCLHLQGWSGSGGKWRGLCRVGTREGLGSGPIWDKEWGGRSKAIGSHQAGNGERGAGRELERRNWSFSGPTRRHHVLGESLFLFLQVANERLPLPTQGEAILPVHVVGMELDSYCFPDDWSMRLNFLTRVLAFCS
jgi:hypothetical protein